MRIVGVIDEDPFDPRTWSGSSRYFFGALRDRGLLHEAIAAEPPAAVAWLHKLRAFQPGHRRWQFSFRVSTAWFAARTRTALQRLSRLRDQDYDVLLQVGAWYDLSSRRDKLRVSYHDGNLAALLASPYPVPAVGRAVLDRALRYEHGVYSRMDMLFPMSRWLADSFMRDFGVPASKLFPIGAGVNLPPVAPVEPRDPGSRRLLFIGKNFPRKGGPVLLEAFRIVRREVPDATLTIIGPTLDLREEGVRCLGYISKDTAQGLAALLQEYRKADVFVMPSLYEPFGIVFAEAMAHELPCVGTRICAMPEIIEDGRTGFLVEPGDSRALAARLIELLREPALRRAMGRAGYVKYRTTFTWDTVVGNLDAHLRDRLGLPSPPVTPRRDAIPTSDSAAHVAPRVQ